LFTKKVVYGLGLLERVSTDPSRAALKDQTEKER